MCGVVGYVGKNLSRSYVLDGLSRLEYRGYDSAGFACLDSNTQQLTYLKAEGQLVNLVHALDQKPLDGFVAIGHTRWSTHGVVSEHNAHPQNDCHERISVVHNGIIENYAHIKQRLKSSHVIRSETDTEVIAHLFEDTLQKNSLKQATQEVVNLLEGAYAFTMISELFPDAMVAVRKGSPLCIGIGADEMFVASDVLAFAGRTDRVIYMPDETFALIHKDGVSIYDFQGNCHNIQAQQVTVSWSNDGKSGYEHFMLKEIYEQKNGIHATLSYLKSIHDDVWQHLGTSEEKINTLKNLSLIGCGTSWHAARIGQFFFEEIAHIPTRVVLASEFRYSKFFAESEGMYIALSQSGETIDTLECIRLINKIGAHTAALTNVDTSSMVREARGYLLTKAGREISVASTKAFSTQLAAQYWLAYRIAVQKGLVNMQQMENALDKLLIAAELLENNIEKYRSLIQDKFAPYYAQFQKALFLGRHISYPFAMEAALKLKEISYIFAQCYPAGELKHGPIALIADDTPIILFSTTDELIYQKLLSNAQEIKARNGHLLVFAFEGQSELAQLADNIFILPKIDHLLSPLAMTGLMQFFVYEVAKVLGCPIDKPRHLAKSVTVE